MQKLNKKVLKLNENLQIFGKDTVNDSTYNGKVIPL